MTTPFLSSPILFASLFSIAQICAAADNASVEFGISTHVKMIRAGLQWKWAKRWWQGKHVYVGGYWDATIAHWRGDRHRNVPGSGQGITAIGVTPVFRLQKNSGKGLYGEAGIGLHWLSDLYDNGGRRLSTHFQFGDHLAFGYIFQNNMDLKLKLQHFSNGSIKKPNDGVNFVILSASMPF